MNIDWGKAPEGATHKDLKYAPTGFWYKFDFKNDTAAYCPHDEKQWVSSGKASEYANDGSMDDMAVRPSVAKYELVREEIVRQMVEIISTYVADVAAAEALYDAGYRKFEIVEDDV
ncbi:hypothetical protein D3C76_789430 [compost metagenome]